MGGFIAQAGARVPAQVRPAVVGRTWVADEDLLLQCLCK